MKAIHRQLLAPFALVACAFLAGCNGTIGALEPALSAASQDGDDDATDADGRRHIGKPYKVAGRWYRPKEDDDYDKVGTASWYGTTFHGRSTANGERFDKYALTAAHPTLPLPSYVRVTVVETGKSAVLRINDRGPFGRGRIIDVSRGAADELGFRQAGHAKVRVEYLGDAPIGGSDRDTRMAARKFGTTSSTPAPAESKTREVEVRLASAEPPSGENKLPPGVSSRYAPRRSVVPERPSSLTAYAAEAEQSGALKAVNAMDEPAAAKAEHPIAAQPLPETASKVTEGRFAGAHDMFASLDGSGISQLADGEAPAAAAAAAEPAASPAPAQ